MRISLFVASALLCASVNLANAQAVIGFHGTQFSGTVSYSGGGGPLQGSNIPIDSLDASNTPLNNGASQPVTGGVLTFQTGNLISYNNGVYTFGPGGSLQIVGTVSGIPGLGSPSVLAQASAVGATLATNSLILTLAGSDTKNTNLLNYFGLSTATTFTFSTSTIHLNILSGGGGGALTAQAFSIDIINIAAPVSPPLRRGDTATIGFWHNQNGQAVINSFNGGPSATNLGSWLASNFPNLFGAPCPYGGQPSCNLAGLSNSQVATFYSNLWTPSGVTKNTYVQVLSTALSCYATSTTLAGSDPTVPQFGFNTSPAGTCSATFNVGNNGAAVGVPNNTTLTILTLLQLANANFAPATGLFYNGDQTLTSELNNIFNGINTSGDIS
jgi:hypothetical protein